MKTQDSSLRSEGEEENINRMKLDNRSANRIQRAVNESRKAFDHVNYPKLDITNMIVSEATKAIIIKMKLCKLGMVLELRRYRFMCRRFISPSIARVYCHPEELATKDLYFDP